MSTRRVASCRCVVCGLQSDHYKTTSYLSYTPNVCRKSDLSENFAGLVPRPCPAGQVPRPCPAEQQDLPGRSGACASACASAPTLPTSPCPRLSWASCAVCLLRAGVCCGLCTRPASDGDMEACAAPGPTGFPGRVLVLGGNAGRAAGVPAAPQEGTLLPPSAVGVLSP